MSGLSRQVLRNMRARWKADLAQFERAYPPVNWEAGMPEIEVVRNLATAIAQLEFMLGRRLSKAKEGHHDGQG